MLVQVTFVDGFDEARAWDHVWCMLSWWKNEVICWWYSLRSVESRIDMKITKLEDWTQFVDCMT